MRFEAGTTWRALAGVLAVSFPATAADVSPQWHALPVDGGIDSVALSAGLEPGLPACEIVGRWLRYLDSRAGG